jgi:hypothetical protein
MFVGMTPSEEPSMRKRRVSDRPVRFLFAPPAANDHKFLVDEQSGEAKISRAGTGSGNGCDGSKHFEALPETA